MTEHEFDDDARHRHVDASNSQGWGHAALIVVLATTLVTLATIYHNRNYHSPNDVTVVSVPEPPGR
jgi:hypothetical protein